MLPTVLLWVPTYSSFINNTLGTSTLLYFPTGNLSTSVFYSALFPLSTVKFGAIWIYLRYLFCFRRSGTHSYEEPPGVSLCRIERSRGSMELRGQPYLLTTLLSFLLLLCANKGKRLFIYLLNGNYCCIFVY